MGVTINFEGKLKSEFDYEQLISKTIDFAKNGGFEFFLIDETNKLLERVKNEENWDYEGPTKGIQIQFNEIIDPLIMEFDRDLYIQEYCKTQFAETNTHIKIINFLKNIEKHFQFFLVNDEGEYWETKDVTILQDNIDNCFRLIEKMKMENTKMDGPYRMSNGRIFDLLTDEE